MQDNDENRGLVSHLGPVSVDWPRSMGYFGGVGLAVAVGLVDPPLALFIAAVPFLRMLNTPGARASIRFGAQVIEGMAKPVGGDAEQTVSLTLRARGSWPLRAVEVPAASRPRPRRAKGHTSRAHER